MELRWMVILSQGRVWAYPILRGGVSRPDKYGFVEFRGFDSERKVVVEGQAKDGMVFVSNVHPNEREWALPKE